MTIRHALNGEDFRTLVSGGTVTKKGPRQPKVQLVLRDIGYEQMLLIFDSIFTEMKINNNPGPREPQGGIGL